MFQCCKGKDSEFIYQVRSKDNHNQQIIKIYDSYRDLDPQFLDDQHTVITKIKKSQFNQIMAKLKSKKQKFQDISFPNNERSLGKIEGVESNWKRISQLIKSPTLFDNKIEPKDVIHNNKGDCYFLSAVAALAQQPKTIRNIFHDQIYNQQGIYKVVLRVNGVVEEVVVDDFIPINKFGAPIFCQPNKTGQFWVLILEKALAKVNGSYANIMQGTPSDVFKAVAYAPSESLIFADLSQQREKVWNLLFQYGQKHYPFCATTREGLSTQLNLQSQHTYTVISAQTITNKDQKQIKIVRLRDPWKDGNWNGSIKIDQHFWDNVPEGSAKDNILKRTDAGQYGLFYLTFEEFCHYFNQIHYCNLSSKGKFTSQQLYVNKKNANYFDLSITRDGVYSLQLNQSTNSNQLQLQKFDTNICRSTILIIKKTQQQSNGKFSDKFQFINGVMKYNEQNTVLTQKLKEGQYVVYAKIDPSRRNHTIPDSSILSLYSDNFSKLQGVKQSKYPNLLQSAFLTQANQNPQKMYYNNNKMWISWKLCFQQGGFAYLAFSNQKDNDHAFVVNFNEVKFAQMHYKLKKPFKGISKDQELRVNPGEQQIILARVINESVKIVKFPPHLDIKIEPL